GQSHAGQQRLVRRPRHGPDFLRQTVRYGRGVRLPAFFSSSRRRARSSRTKAASASRCAESAATHGTGVRRKSSSTTAGFAPVATLGSASRLVSSEPMHPKRPFRSSRSLASPHGALQYGPSKET